LAATEVLRRRSAVALRRQLVRAERNVERKDYERSLAEYDRAIAAAPTDVPGAEIPWRSEEHTSELQSRFELVCRPLLEKKNSSCVFVDPSPRRQVIARCLPSAIVDHCGTPAESLLGSPRSFCPGAAAVLRYAPASSTVL